MDELRRSKQSLMSPPPPIAPLKQIPFGLVPPSSDITPSELDGHLNVDRIFADISLIDRSPSLIADKSSGGLGWESDGTFLFHTVHEDPSPPPLRSFGGQIIVPPHLSDNSQNEFVIPTFDDTHRKVLLPPAADLRTTSVFTDEVTILSPRRSDGFEKHFGILSPPTENFDHFIKGAGNNKRVSPERSVYRRTPPPPPQQATSEINETRNTSKRPSHRIILAPVSDEVETVKGYDRFEESDEEADIATSNASSPKFDPSGDVVRHDLSPVPSPPRGSVIGSKTSSDGSDKESNFVIPLIEEPHIKSVNFEDESPKQVSTNTDAVGKPARSTTSSSTLNSEQADGKSTSEIVEAPTSDDFEPAKISSSYIPSPTENPENNQSQFGDSYASPLPPPNEKGQYHHRKTSSQQDLVVIRSSESTDMTSATIVMKGVSSATFRNSSNNSPSAMETPRDEYGQFAVVNASQASKTVIHVPSNAENQHLNERKTASYCEQDWDQGGKPSISSLHNDMGDDVPAIEVTMSPSVSVPTSPHDKGADLSIKEAIESPLASPIQRRPYLVGPSGEDTDENIRDEPSGIFEDEGGNSCFGFDSKQRFAGASNTNKKGSSSFDSEEFKVYSSVGDDDMLANAKRVAEPNMATKAIRRRLSSTSDVITTKRVVHSSLSELRNLSISTANESSLLPDEATYLRKLSRNISRASSESPFVSVHRNSMGSNSSGTGPSKLGFSSGVNKILQDARLQYEENKKAAILEASRIALHRSTVTIKQRMTSNYQKLVKKSSGNIHQSHTQANSFTDRQAHNFSVISRRGQEGLSVVEDGGLDYSNVSELHDPLLIHPPYGYRLPKKNATDCQPLATNSKEPVVGGTLSRSGGKIDYGTPPLSPSSRPRPASPGSATSDRRTGINSSPPRHNDLLSAIASKPPRGYFIELDHDDKSLTDSSVYNNNETPNEFSSSRHGPTPHQIPLTAEGSPISLLSDSDRLHKDNTMSQLVVAVDDLAAPNSHLSSDSINEGILKPTRSGRGLLASGGQRGNKLHPVNTAPMTVSPKPSHQRAMTANAEQSTTDPTKNESSLPLSATFNPHTPNDGLASSTNLNTAGNNTSFSPQNGLFLSSVINAIAQALPVGNTAMANGSIDPNGNGASYGLGSSQSNSQPSQVSGSPSGLNGNANSTLSASANNAGRIGFSSTGMSVIKEVVPHGRKARNNQLASTGNHVGGRLTMGGEGEGNKVENPAGHNTYSGAEYHRTSIVDSKPNSNPPSPKQLENAKNPKVEMSEKAVADDSKDTRDTKAKLEPPPLQQVSEAAETPKLDEELPQSTTVAPKVAELDDIHLEIPGTDEAKPDGSSEPATGSAEAPTLAQSPINNNSGSRRESHPSLVASTTGVARIGALSVASDQHNTTVVSQLTMPSRLASLNNTGAFEIASRNQNAISEISASDTTTSDSTTDSSSSSTSSDDSLVERKRNYRPPNGSKPKIIIVRRRNPSQSPTKLPLANATPKKPAGVLIKKVIIIPKQRVSLTPSKALSLNTSTSHGSPSTSAPGQLDDAVSAPVARNVTMSPPPRRDPENESPYNTGSVRRVLSSQWQRYGKSLQSVDLHQQETPLGTAVLEPILSEDVEDFSIDQQPVFLVPTNAMASAALASSPIQLADSFIANDENVPVNIGGVPADSKIYAPTLEHTIRHLSESPDRRRYDLYGYVNNLYSLPHGPLLVTPPKQPGGAYVVSPGMKFFGNDGEGVGLGDPRRRPSNFPIYTVNSDSSVPITVDDHNHVELKTLRKKSLLPPPPLSPNNEPKDQARSKRHLTMSQFRFPPPSEIDNESFSNHDSPTAFLGLVDDIGVLYDPAVETADPRTGEETIRRYFPHVMNQNKLKPLVPRGEFSIHSREVSVEAFDRNERLNSSAPLTASKDLPHRASEGVEDVPIVLTWHSSSQGMVTKETLASKS